MEIIRHWFSILRLLPCAIIVFFAYAKMGYYPWSKVFSAVGAYYKEKQKLNGHVLVEYLWGFFPVGTLMCSVDPGWLPVDDVFPVNMQQIRQVDVRLGYFGKLAVLPYSYDKDTGKRLIARAKKWAYEEQLDRAIILVHPRHVPYYLRVGYRKIHLSSHTPGLEKAPAVLLCIDRE